jgi:glycosyltransferase involved in cell wall biosynthesis
MKKILHIAVHLGGGVGKAIIGMASFESEEFTTQVITLEPLEKTKILDYAEERGVVVHVCPEHEECMALIREADIVVINWWNHPVMSRFLYEFPQTECRLVAWIHVNGCAYPYLPFQFADCFDYIFFTGKYAYENKLWNEEQLKKITEKSDVILGNGDFSPALMPVKTDYENKEDFRIGYVGTLNYAKISRDYVGYCESVIEACGNVKFVIAGDMGADLYEDIEKSRYRSAFELLDFVEDIESLYLTFDVLGYILNDEHYGTTENVILEAMACGVPVVANDGGAERAIIDNGVNGYLVHNMDEYAQCIGRLKDNAGLREKIGAAGREKVCRKFSCTGNREKFYQLCQDICTMEKSIHQFKNVLGDKPTDWFLYFTGKDRKIFEAYLDNPNDETGKALLDTQPIYKGERKSSVKHFLNYYPQEQELTKLARGLEKN